MASLKLEVMPDNTSPLSAIVEGRTYQITFGPDRVIVIPRPLAMVLVSTGLCRDRGQVPASEGGGPWPNVSPEWPGT